MTAGALWILFLKKMPVLLEMCRKYDCNYILIDDRYEVEIDL